MKFLTLCIVLSALLALSWASPAKNNLRDLNDSSSSSEENEQVIAESNKNNIVEDIKEEDNDSSSSSSEEVVEKPKKRHRVIVVDDNDEVVNSNNILRLKRSLNVDPHASNQLKVKDEGSIKYEKYLKLKTRLRRDLETDESDSDTNEINVRYARSADTSEEDSSEEKKKGSKHADHHHHEAKHEHNEVKHEDHEVKPEHSADAVKQEEETHAETEQKTHEEPVKAEGSRRKRNLEDSSEENQSAQDLNANEVFIFSNEAQPASEENLKNDRLNNIEYKVVSEAELEKSLEKKSSDEDYAQGCGGNRDDNSNDNSDENNETTYNEQ